MIDDVSLKQHVIGFPKKEERQKEKIKFRVLYPNTTKPFQEGHKDSRKRHFIRVRISPCLRKRRRLRRRVLLLLLLLVVVLLLLYLFQKRRRRRLLSGKRWRWKMFRLLRSERSLRIRTTRRRTQPFLLLIIRARRRKKHQRWISVNLYPRLKSSG